MTTGEETGSGNFMLINIDPFYRDFELKNQINASSGSVMDNMQKDLTDQVIRNLIIFCLLQKALMQKHGLNYTEHLTENILPG